MKPPAIDAVASVTDTRNHRAPRAVSDRFGRIRITVSGPGAPPVPARWDSIWSIAVAEWRVGPYPGPGRGIGERELTATGRTPTARAGGP